MSGRSAWLLAGALLLAPTAGAAQQAVTNVAVATYQTIGGNDSVVSNPVQTVLLQPQAMLQKTLIGPTAARIGQTIQYRIDYGNGASGAPLLSALLTDSLPTGLDFVSSQPGATLTGRTLSWSLGDLAPGTTGQVVLTVAVSSGVTDTLRVRNVAVLDARNASRSVALAAEVQLIGPPSRALTLAKAADALEVGLGETAPYTLTVTNAGTLPLTDLRIVDRLPGGTRLARGSMSGADSVRVAGQTLTFYLAGPLFPGAVARVRYAAAIVSASAGVLWNSALATAEAGTVQAAEARASIRLRAQDPMATRAAIGKVWLDVNGNGVQDADDPGVEGVEVWTPDGEVATTDREGRFSYRNLRAGQHGFRVNPASLPAEYRLADGEARGELEVRDASGWTTPRVAFRLVSRGARLAGVRLPAVWSFAARPLEVPRPAAHDILTAEPPPPPDYEIVVAQPESLPTASVPAAPPLILKQVAFAVNRATLTEASSATLTEVAASLRLHPDARIEVGGHTDASGSRSHNMRLSLARARAVVHYLIQAGIDSSRLEARGYGPDRPVASNRRLEGRARNRRSELTVLLEERARDEQPQGMADAIRRELLASGSIEASVPLPRVSAPDPVELDVAAAIAHSAVPAAGPVVAYEVGIDNRYGVPLEGLSVRLPAPLDSAMVRLGASIVGRGTGPVVALPVIPPHDSLRLLAWGTRQGDSATAVLEQSGDLLDRADAAVRNSVVPLRRLLPPRFATDSLPAPAAVPADGVIDVVLAPPETGWPGEAIWSLPTGWEAVPGSAHLGSAAVPDPLREGDGRGGTRLRWPSLANRTDSLTITLRPAGQEPPVEVVSVGTLQSPDERTAEQRRSLVVGPGVEIFAPGDGTVLRTDRLYVGVRGEANAPVTLFDGDSVLAEANIRIDGVQDFIAVALTPGPHHLRARMRNSWGAERWDSIAVHVSHLPDRFVAAESPLQLIADGHSERVVRVRALDRWGVPVVNGPFVTVSGIGAEPVNRDGDPSSVGLQLQADAAGWIAVVLRAGTSVRSGRLSLKSGEATGSVGLDLLPAVGPLFLTGVGRVGVGASPGDFGALTARGRLDRRTSLTLSYDSRRLNEGRDNFGRSYDPLEEAQYPILGDAGSHRSLGASRYQVSARIERGYDWLAFGDVSITGFDDGLKLTSYRRALPGAAGRITSGPVQWQGFFSSTRQSVQQLQLRGAGTSGPYDLGADIAPGTEDVRLESRAPENAQRVISQQGLVRYIDYQIDYERGTLLLKQPVPAMDTYGNPVFIVLTYETRSGGPRRGTWGVRAVGDAGRLLASHPADSIQVGATVIHDGAGIGARSLSGLDLRLRNHRGLGLNAELSHSTGADSTGYAVSLDGTAELLKGALLLSGGWMRVGNGYRNPANFGIQGGSEEFKLGGRYRAGPANVRLEHEEQRFDLAGVRRSRTVGGVTRSLGSALQLDATLTDDRGVTSGLRDASTAGEAKLSWTAMPRLKLWAEGRRQLAQEGTAVRPDYAGMGAALQVGSGASLEARHRRVVLPDGGGSYGVTGIGVRAHVAQGTEAWSSYELAGVNGGQSAALVGLNNRLTLGRSWALNAMLERRMGVGQAAIGDPVRALPFVQVEENYWSAALGAEYLPQEAPYRLSARGELRNGDIRSSRLLTLAGDVSLTSSLALLSRQEFLRSDQRLSTGPLATRQYNSLWGVALRPVHSDRFNVLGKFQWINARNPAGAGVLAQQGDESRVIAALEGIWSPAARSEFALRYAARRTSSTVLTSDSLQRDLRSSAEFIGWRARQDLTRKIGARAEGRLLLERTSGTNRWDLAPQLYYLPVPVLEMATGYRFGDLRDPDFAVDGGHGWFLTFGARLTEQSLANAAAFWRNRLGGQ